MRQPQSSQPPLITARTSELVPWVIIIRRHCPGPSGWLVRKSPHGLEPPQPGATRRNVCQSPATNDHVPKCPDDSVLEIPLPSNGSTSECHGRSHCLPSVREQGRHPTEAVQSPHTTATPERTWRGLPLPAGGAAEVNLPEGAGHIVVRIMVRNENTSCLSAAIMRHYADHNRW
jgi:hypothetical protein